LHARSGWHSEKERNLEEFMSETRNQEAKTPKVLPKPNSDSYQTFQMLSAAEMNTLILGRAVSGFSAFI
jgi:hypothetical protein